MVYIDQGVRPPAFQPKMKCTSPGTLSHMLRFTEQLPFRVRFLSQCGCVLAKLDLYRKRQRWEGRDTDHGTSQLVEMAP